MLLARSITCASVAPGATHTTEKGIADEGTPSQPKGSTLGRETKKYLQEASKHCGVMESSNAIAAFVRQAPVAWNEGKNTLLYHVELASDLLVQLMTIAHYLHVWYLHGMTLHVVDAILLLDIRAVVNALGRRLQSYWMYCACTRR
jgi:hypothetical protein